MTNNKPSEQAMNNFYMFLSRVLPKYLAKEEPPARRNKPDRKRAKSETA